MPKVSVIIPVFNCELYLEDRIRSVTCQTERDLEIIVVDDGSTDNSLMVAKQLGSQDTRISVYASPHSGRQGVPRNIGLSKCRGEYVSFLDADDLYHPGKLRACLTVLESFGDVDIIFHDVLCFGELGEDLSGFFRTTCFLPRAGERARCIGVNTYLIEDLYAFSSLHFNPFRTSSTLMRRSALAPTGPWFREDLHNAEDGDFWLRFLKGREVIALNKVLSYYLTHAGSLGADSVQQLLGSIQIHSENLMRGAGLFNRQQIKQYKSKIAQQLFEVGYLFFQRASLQEARTAYLGSMRVSLHRAAVTAYLKTFLPQAVLRKRWTRQQSQLESPKVPGTTTETRAIANKVFAIEGATRLRSGRSRIVF